MPELLPIRTIDPDRPSGQSPRAEGLGPRRGIEATILAGLMTAYPLAPVVEEVDGKFLQLLEAMAALDLGAGRKA